MNGKGCTPITLMKNHKLKVLETKVLRKIYGPKREVEE